MKYVASFAAAAVAMLVCTGAAFAKSQPQASVASAGREVPRAWLDILRAFPLDPKPLPVRPRPVAPPVRHVRHFQPAHVVQRSQPTPQTTTLSFYEHTASQPELRDQGCSAAQRLDQGVVVLDFGKLAYQRGGYGTMLFSGRFAKNRIITVGLAAWARGYTSCLPQGSDATVTVARGTSNYYPAVPSAYTAGLRWGRETNRLAILLQQDGLSAHVTAAGADDAEPAWDPRFHKTRDFVHGFRQAVRGHGLYDYGSLDGGIGSIWSARQAFYVAGGIGGTKALPEIYYASQAREWAELAAVARSEFHSSVRFAGVMTQGSRHCHCGFRPLAAHHALTRALASEGVRQALVPGGGTDIVG